MIKKLNILITILFFVISISAMSSQRLITLPYDETDNGCPKDIIIKIIESAKKTIDLAEYQIKDQEVISALKKAHDKGINIRIITEYKPFTHEKNQEKNTNGGLEQLEKANILIRGLPQRFIDNDPKTLAHYKFLIIDNSYAVVMTFNWDEASISCDSNNRNFMLVLDKDKKKDAQIVDDLIGTFDADWNNIDYKCKSQSMVVGPGFNLDRESQRKQIINLFLQAKHSIEIYTQSYNDDAISEVLENIAKQGIVKVRLITPPFPFGRKYDLCKWSLNLKQAGGEVHLWGPNGWPDVPSFDDNTNLYVHAKIIIIDGKEAYIGSCNYYKPSLEIGRELGVITKDPTVVNKLTATFRKDWVMSEGWLENQKNLSDIIITNGSVISQNRITPIDIKYYAFDDSIKTLELNVLDVTSDSVKEIFEELFNEHFPIYYAVGYENRNIINGDKPSLHAYGAAIDINPHLNPYYNVLKGASSIDPHRCIDKSKDEESMRHYLHDLKLNEPEINLAIKAIIQETEPDDWFVNRCIYRKGMLTEHHAEIFRKHGFGIWGGKWKQPMDFMHFQIDRQLAEQLAAASSDEAIIIWRNYLHENMYEHENHN